MKIFRSTTYLAISAVLTLIFLCNELFAQTAKDSLTEERFFNDIYSHRTGVGLSLSAKDASGNMNMMFSAFYQYRFSPLLALELSGNALHTTFNQEQIRYRAVFLTPKQVQVIPEFNSATQVSHALSGNLVAVFAPFADKRLHFGVGASYRWAGLLSLVIATRLDSISQTYSIRDTQQFALGANAHVEYIFGLSGNVDIGLRLHGQFFFPPIDIKGDIEPLRTIVLRQIYGNQIGISPADFYDWNVGLGAFLRIGF